MFEEPTTVISEESAMNRRRARNAGQAPQAPLRPVSEMGTGAPAQAMQVPQGGFYQAENTAINGQLQEALATSSAFQKALNASLMINDAALDNFIDDQTLAEVTRSKLKEIRNIAATRDPDQLKKEDTIKLLTDVATAVRDAAKHYAKQQNDLKLQVKALQDQQKKAEETDQSRILTKEVKQWETMYKDLEKQIAPTFEQLVGRKMGDNGDHIKDITDVLTAAKSFYDDTVKTIERLDNLVNNPVPIQAEASNQNGETQESQQSSESQVVSMRGTSQGIKTLERKLESIVNTIKENKKNATFHRDYSQAKLSAVSNPYSVGNNTINQQIEVINKNLEDSQTDEQQADFNDWLEERTRELMCSFSDQPANIFLLEIFGALASIHNRFRTHMQHEIEQASSSVREAESKLDELVQKLKEREDAARKAKEEADAKLKAEAEKKKQEADAKKKEDNEGVAEITGTVETDDDKEAELAKSPIKINMNNIDDDTESELLDYYPGVDDQKVTSSLERLATDSSKEEVVSSQEARELRERQQKLNALKTKLHDFESGFVSVEKVAKSEVSEKCYKMESGEEPGYLRKKILNIVYIDEINRQQQRIQELESKIKTNEDRTAELSDLRAKVDLLSAQNKSALIARDRADGEVAKCKDQLNDFQVIQSKAHDASRKDDEIKTLNISLQKLNQEKTSLEKQLIEERKIHADEGIQLKEAWSRLENDQASDRQKSAARRDQLNQIEASNSSFREELERRERELKAKEADLVVRQGKRNKNLQSGLGEGSFVGGGYTPRGSHLVGIPTESLLEDGNKSAFNPGQLSPTKNDNEMSFEQKGSGRSEHEDQILEDYSIQRKELERLRESLSEAQKKLSEERISFEQYKKSHSDTSDERDKLTLIVKQLKSSQAQRHQDINTSRYRFKFQENLVLYAFGALIILGSVLILSRNCGCSK